MLRSLSWKCSRLFAGRLSLSRGHSNRQLVPIRSIMGNNLLKYPLTTSNKFPIFRITHSFWVKWSSSLPSHNKIVLPALSPTMEVGTIKEWKLKEGEKLLEGEVLAEIETDKAVMDFACPDHIAEGYLAKIIAQEGVKDIKIGSYICIMVQNKEDVESFIDYVVADTDVSDSPAPAQQTPPSASPAPIEQQQQQQQQQQQAPPAGTAPQIVETGGRLKVSPYARKLASERGVDLSSLSGSGPGGRIVADDVTQAGPARKRVYTGPRTDVPLPTYTEIEMSNIRRTIAKRLLESKQNIPHYYLQVEVGMDEIARLRNEFNAISPDLPSLSVNDFIIKATAAALKSVPECNTSYHEEYCIRQHHNVDVCVAVATDGGLLTPIIFTADKKGLREINRDVTELAEKAKLGNLQPQEFIGGTFTISNLGMYGISSFSAIINPPQSCILAIGATRDVIVPDEDGCYKTAKVMSCQLSCDHRVVDGAVGAKWLKEFKRVMECPAAMLL